jgi:hypothetical protein
MIEKRPVDPVRNACATIVAASSVSVSQSPLRLVLEPLRSSNKKSPSLFTPIIHRNRNESVPGKSPSIRGRVTSACFPVDGTCFGRTERGLYGYSRKGSLPCVRSNSMRTTNFSILAAVDICGGLNFARTEGSYNSTKHFVEPSKAFTLMSGDVLPIGNVAFHKFPLRSSFSQFYRGSVAFHYYVHTVARRH